MNCCKRLQRITVDGREYNYTVGCLKYDDMKRVRALIEVAPHRIEKLTSVEPITKESIVKFIRRRRLDK